MLHPLEVGSLLSLEDTDTDAIEIEDRFGRRVSALVLAVSEDDSIEDEQARKAALRMQVARSPIEAAAVFAADKVSKARELRLTLSCGLPGEEAGRKLDHYTASLSMLERRLGRGHVILEQLGFELEALSALPPA